MMVVWTLLAFFAGFYLGNLLGWRSATKKCEAYQDAAIQSQQEAIKSNDLALERLRTLK